MAKKRRKRRKPKEVKKRRRRPGEGRWVNVGRTFADRAVPDRWYVYLKVDGAYVLVWWEGGKPRMIDRNKVRLESFEFSMAQLLARWGITPAELDAFLEQHMYRWDDDVRNVRATRRPLTGRTLEVVPERHRVARR